MKKITLLLFFMAFTFQMSAQLPLEGFEGTWNNYSILGFGEQTAGPPDWYIRNVAPYGIAKAWARQATSSTYPSHSGTYAAFMDRENAGGTNQTEDWLVTKQFPVPVNGQLRFFSRLTINGNNNSIYDVRIGTDPTDPSTFTSLIDADGWTELEINPTQQEYAEKVLPIPSSYAVGSQVYIAFILKTTGSGDRWLIDDVSVLSQCDAPADTSLTATNIGTTTADLGWANPSGITSWEVAVLPAADAFLGTGTTYNGLPPYPASGLTASTAYKFYVRAICGSGDTANPSEWVGPFNFTTVAVGATCAAAINIPSLPYSVSGNTSAYGDDYSGTPGASCATTGNYLNGDDVVYAYTATADGVISVNVNGNGNNTGVFVYDSCADIGVSCLEGGTGSATSPINIPAVEVTTGETYYIVISTTGSPQSTAYNLTVQVVNCAPPTNLAATGVDADSAILSWNTNAASSWEIVVQNQGGGIPSGSGTTITNNTNYTVTATTAGVDFTPATAYEYYVRADCGDGTFSAWTGPFVFTTTQVPATAPFITDFETPSGMFLSNGTNVNKWVVGTATSNSPTHSLYISNDNGVTTNYTNNVTVTAVHAYRDIQMPAVDQAALSFDWKGIAENCCDYLRVWIVPSSYTPTPGTQITAGTNRIQIGGNYNNNANWSTVTQTFNAAAYSGQILRLVFEWHNDGSVGTAPAAAVDNISLSVITCPQPTNLTIASLTNTDVTYTWTGPTSVTPTYDYYFSTSSTAPTAATTPTGNTATPTVTIGSLQPSTTYYFWVRSHCSDTDQSFWTGPVSFNTPQIPGDLNYSEDFEGTIPWTLINGNQTNKWIVGTATSNSPTHSLYITNDNGVSNAYNNTSTSVVQAYRDLAVPAGTTDAALQFDWKAIGENCCDYLRVWLVPVTFTPTAGTQITTGANRVQIGGNRNNNGTWTTETDIVSLTNYAGSTVRLVFEWRNDGSIGTMPPAAVDNVNLSIITCPQPTNLAISAVSDSEVTYTWSGPTNAGSYDYYFATTNTAPTATTTPTGNVNAATVTIGSLQPSTTYYFWVRSNCGSGDTSFWTGPVSFTTPQIPADLNYSEDFEGPIAWTLNNGTQTNKWVVGTATSLSPTHSLYISNDNGATNAYNTSSTSVVQAYRDIAVPAGTTDATLMFDWKAQGESSFDYLRVWLVPITFTPTPGTQITAGTNRLQINGNLNQTATWTNVTQIVNLSPYAGSAVRVVFEWRNDGSAGTMPPAAVDNVNLAVITCPKPIDLMAEGQNNSDILLSWTPTGSETQWEVVIVPNGSAPPGNNPTLSYIVDEPQFLAENIPSSTFFDFYVRAICSDDDMSFWAGPSPFSIFAPPGCANIGVTGPEDVVITNGSEFVICPGDEACLDLTAEYYETGESTDYEVETIAYNPPFPFNGGTELNVTTDDIWSPVVNLPFDFCFYGQTFNEAKVGSNGVVMFGDNMTDGGYCPWPFTTTIPNTGFPILNAIYGAYQDINPATGGDNVSINYQVLGTYPCRALVVNYYDVDLFQCGGPTQTSQIVIYEISNIIEVYVQHRSSCTTWTNPNAVIGVQNATGTAAVVPPGYNTGTWSADNVAFRFTPSGATNVVFEWLQDGVALSDQNTVNICVDDETVMTARATYTSCNGDEIVRENDFTIRLSEPIVLGEPQDLTACSTGNEVTFNLDDAMDGVVADPSQYNITYYLTEEAASLGEDDISSTYTTDTPQTIYVRVADGPCFATTSFDLILQNNPPQFTLTDDFSICEGNTFTLEVTPGSFDVADATYTWTLDGNPLADTGATLTATAAGTYEVIVAVDGCEATDTVTVTAIPAPVPDAPDDVAACDSYTLPALTVGDYYTETGAAGDMLSEGDVITETTTLYVYAASNVNDCSNENSFTVTISTTPVIVPAEVEDVTACGQYTLPALTVGEYYDAADGGGNMIPEGTLITSDQTIYVYAASADNPDCSANESFDVTIVPSPIPDDPADVTACDSYTLEPLTAGAYYTGSQATGDMLSAGDVITETSTIYVYLAATAGDCYVENTFTVTITPSPVIVPEEVEDVAVCDSYILPALTVGDYYDAANGAGNMIPAGTELTASQTVYVHAVSAENAACTADDSFEVTITTSPVADAPIDVAECESYTLPALTVGNYFTGPNGTGNALSAGDVITQTSTIYVYAVSTENADCTNENTFTVTITSPVILPGEIDDVTACDSYVLPALTVGDYYDAPNGGGNMIAAGTTLTASQTVYVHAAAPTDPNCTTDAQFEVTITDSPVIVPAEAADVAQCDKYILPALTVGNYYTGPNGTGTQLAAGTEIAATQTVYIYAVAAGNGNCTAEEEVTITIVPTPQVAITEGCNDDNAYELQAGFTDGIYNPDSDATYVWTDANGAQVGTGPSLIITTPGTYNVTVVPVDVADCPVTASINVLQTSCTIQRGISPNNDGMNDDFDLTGLNVKKLSIFNRYGKEVYSFSNYTNQWHGQTSNGEELPTGTYFYMIQRESGESTTGWIYINRQVK